SPVLCKLLGHGRQLRILLASEIRQSDDRLFSGGCHLSYETSTFNGHAPKMLSVMVPSEWPDVILTLAEEPSLSQLHVNGSKTTLVRIPRADLPYSYWMGTLSLKEWQSECLKGIRYCFVALTASTLTPIDWNAPRIDISVITKDRPRSLRRLLSSLT